MNLYLVNLVDIRSMADPFSSDTSRISSSSQGVDNIIQPCQLYARIYEKNKIYNITGCLGDGRERHVYTSDTNIVRVEILPNSVPRINRKFLLKHEGEKFEHVDEYVKLR